MRVGNEMRVDCTGFQPLEPFKEFAANKRDSLASSESKDNTESFSSKIGRWFCCIPMGIGAVVKRVIYFLSCCMLCKESADLKALMAALDPVVEVWKKAGVTKEKKEAAWDEFERAFPNQKDQMATILVEQHKAALKPTKWTEDQAKGIRDNFEARFKKFDTTLLDNYMTYLQTEIDEKK